MSRFGQFFKARRGELGLSLRAFCRQHDIDPSNLSKIERGVLPPPQGETLRRYATCLKLTEGSDAWYEFCDLAAAEAGRLPEDLQQEDFAGKLPVLFRTLRDHANDGGADSKELLRELRAKLKGA